MGRKSGFLAYLLWFFFGSLGVHRFYLGRTGSGIAMLLLNVIGSAGWVFGLGWILHIPLAIWLFVDLFMTGVMVGQHNRSVGG